MAGGVAILAAIALVGLTSADWYSFVIDFEGPGPSGYVPQGDLDAWIALEWEPWALIAAAIAVVATIYLRAYDLDLRYLGIAAAVFAVGVVVWRLIDNGQYELSMSGSEWELDPEWGIWTSLAASLVMLVAVIAAVREPRRGRRPRFSRES
jgi:hypothetical protein